MSRRRVASGLTHAAILGVVSLILWSLILSISVKYPLLILRADNRGEGGIVALAFFGVPTRQVVEFGTEIEI